MLVSSPPTEVHLLALRCSQLDEALCALRLDSTVRTVTGLQLPIAVTIPVDPSMAVLLRAAVRLGITDDAPLSVVANLSTAVVLPHLCAAIADRLRVSRSAVEVRAVVRCPRTQQVTAAVCLDDCRLWSQKTNAFAPVLSMDGRGVASLQLGELLVVLRLRAGKGKAGFQRELQRRGRQYVQAIRMGAVEAAGGTGRRAAAIDRLQAVGAARRRGGGFGHGHRHTRPHATPAAIGEGRPTAAADEASVPKTPEERALLSEQSALRARNRERQDEMRTAVAAGIQLLFPPNGTSQVLK